MERNGKKGQVAIEFLMTYGWAILVAIIAIAVLAYYGVFNASKLVSDVFAVDPPFKAMGGQVIDGSALNASDSIKLELYNRAGETITLSTIAISGCTTTAGLAPDVTSYNPGDTKNTTIICDSPTDLGSPGALFKGDISVKYTSQSSTLIQQSKGIINARIATL